MKTFLNFSAIAFLIIIGVSCSSGDDEPPILSSISTSFSTPPPSPTDVIATFEATLVPATEANYTSPYGDAKLQFNQTAKTLKIVLSIDNFNPNYGNIHTADGAIIFIFPAGLFRGGSNIFPFPINEDQITELLANHYYVNINGPNGDINGQLIRVY